MKKILLFIILSGWLFTSYGQEITVKGIVTDKANRQPVPNALITATESGNKTLTDFDGKFSLRAKPGEWLVITADMFQTKRIRAKENLVIFLEPKAVSLDEIVVKVDPLQEPVHSVIINDETLKGSQPRNAADLFDNIPGFAMQKRSSTSLEPSLRAFKYEEMNIKLNGGTKIANACPNRMDPMMAHIIPEAVGKIEVISGPYSVRFGQTFGGIVNLVTQGNASVTPGLHGNWQSGYETNGRNVVQRGELQYVRRNYDLGIDLEHRSFGDYKDGSGIVTPAGFITDSYSLKAGYKPGDNQYLRLNWHQKFGSQIKHAGLPMDSPKDNSEIVNLDYRYAHISPKIRSFTVKLYHSYVDHLMTNGYGMEKPRPNYPAIDARSPVWARTAGGKVEIAWKPADNWLVYTGADNDYIQRDGSKHVIININPNTGQPLNPPVVKNLKIWQNAYINDAGVYAEAHHTAGKNWTFIAGLRADYVTSQAKDPDPGFVNLYGHVGQKTDITVGATASVKYKNGPFLAQLAYGRGTRTPSMLERYIYRFTVGEDARQYIGNPHLRPEINNQIELGGEWRNNLIHIGGSIYYSLFQDYITPVINPALGSGSGGCGGGGTPMAPRQFINVQAYQYGATAFANLRVTSHFIIKTGLNYIKAYDQSLHEPLAQVQPPSASLGLAYKTRRYWIDLRGEFVAKQNDYAPSFGETATPGHKKFDLRAGFKPNDRFSIGGAVLNLTDEAYYNHLNFAFRNAGPYTGRRIYEPGRSFSLFVKYKF